MQVPLLMEMAGQAVVCVGAGPVAAAKVAPLLEAGADVTVIAPDVDPRLTMAPTVERRRYAPDDLDRQPAPRLVIAGTGISAVDQQVADDAADRGVWCLRIDGQGDVAVPSVLRRGGVTVAIGTGAPALTTRLREVVDEVLEDRWGEASAVLARLRGDAEVRAAMAAVEPTVRRRRWHLAVDAVLGSPPAAAAEVEAILRGGDRTS